MNKKLLFFGAIFVALLSVCFLIFLRVVPTTQIWDKYNVLYVDSEASVQDIRAALSTHNIEGVLYPDHIAFPKPSTLAPVQYYQAPFSTSYEQLQSSFFYDRDQNYNLYYIPTGNNESVFNALENVSYAWGLDIQATIPALPFVISVLLTLILVYYTKRKSYFLCLQTPFVLLSLVAPFYHIGAAVCLAALAIFMIQKYWNREYQLQKIAKNALSIFAVVFLLIGAALLGFRVIGLLLLASTASLSLLYVLIQIKETSYNNSAFKPIRIHTAKTVHIHSIYSIKFMLIGLLSIGILTAFSTLNIQPLQKSLKKALHIPSPSGYTVLEDFSVQSYEQAISESQINDAHRLPSFSDYVNAQWQFDAYPYDRLHDTSFSIVRAGETIEQIDYIRNGFELEEQTSIIATFDDTYIQNVINDILLSANAGAEKLLASQKGFSQVQYTQSGTMASPPGAIVLLLLSCAYLIYLIIGIKLKRR